jgi:predicted negative regulator of RcsB-dependent stress response
MAEHGAGHEAEEVKEVVWTYTGWAVILLICIGAGVFIGYEMWGQATSLQAQLTEQTETVNRLKNERETIKSQLALATRDKEACQRTLAASGGGAGGGGAPAGGAPAGGAPASAPAGGTP